LERAAAEVLVKQEASKKINLDLKQTIEEIDKLKDEEEE